MRRKKTIGVEVLESRRLLSVSGSSLAFPLTQGATWATKDIEDGSTDSYTVAGPATFNGHSTTKITDISKSPGNPDSNISLYVGFDSSGNFGTFGDVTVSTDNSSTPATTDTTTATLNPLLIAFPATMVAGTTYSFTSADHGVNQSYDGSTTTTTTSDITINYTLKLISETKQSITVPAGTFSCYQIDETETFSSQGHSFTSTSSHWISPGTYPVKSVDNGPLGSGTTTTVLTASNVKKPATKLAFGVQPSSVVVNAAITPSVTVNVEAADGTIVGADKSTVTLSVASVTPAGGTISGTLSVAAVGGTATFSNLKFSKPGTYTLKATDGSLTSATSSSFVVKAATSATKLAFGVQPSAVNTSARITPAVTVKVENPDGSVNTTDSSTVTLAIASGPTGGKLNGTTAISAVNGVATFSNLIFNVAGTYTLKATDGSLTSATSNSFKVTVAPVPSKLAFATQPVDTTAGKAISPAVKVNVETAAGAVITSDKSTVTLVVQSGPGALTGTISVAAVNGVATFSNLILSKAGTYVLRAVDGSLTSATSNTFKIIAAAASKLVFGTQPAATVAAGKAIAPAVVVNVVDPFGNIVTTNTSSVKIAVATGPAGGTLTGTATVSAKAGVATFSSLLLNKVGSYALKATDGSLASATSNTFKVVAAAASKLIIKVQPAATTTAGKAISPAVVVDVVDQFGNIVTTDTSSVKIAIATGPSGGTLNGTATVSAKAGVATFSNLLLTKAGSYAIKVTDGSLTSVTSSTFKVVAAAAAKLAIIQAPQTRQGEHNPVTGHHRRDRRQLRQHRDDQYVKGHRFHRQRPHRRSA